MQITRNLKELDLLDSYDSSFEASDIVSEFFEPALSASRRYLRLAGYFNSGMLAACARGMSRFLLSDGQMKLVCSPHLSDFDISSLEKAETTNERFSIFDAAISRGIEGLENLEDLLEKEHIEAMCWLLQESRLEVRIAVPRGQVALGELFHQKRGILEDSEGHKVSFSGSINETHAGWTSNVEEFKVFRSWIPGQAAYLSKDEEAFLQHWNSSPLLKHETRPLSDAIREALVKRAPADISRIDLSSSKRKAAIPTESKLRKLRSYQEAAVAAWNRAGRRGILQMATGAGKTLVASHCIDQVLRPDGGIVVITAPYQHIAMQWEAELDYLNPVCLWKSTRWKTQLEDSVRSLRTGLSKSLVIITVQNTAASQAFLDILAKLPSTVPSTLVADEAHGLGAPQMSRALSPLFESRLGLTATPTRYFDPSGSSLLDEYFGGCIYKFSLEEALNTYDENGRTILCPYEYNPIFFRLTQDELDKYRDLSLQIIRLGGRKDASAEERRQNLLIKRARIVKASTAKLPKLSTLLDELPALEKLILYCENLEQMTLVAEELGRRGVVYSRFSGDESTKPESSRGGLSEREAILENFTEGKVDALVAMKCLDEGVNIPTAETAIFLSSSGNEKEFIQRRGRMMRQSPSTGKLKARIFDFVALPDIRETKHDLSNDEKKIIENEMRRLQEFSLSALNATEVGYQIRVMLEKLGLIGEVELGRIV